MAKNIYMHLINGRPARYLPGEQLLFVDEWHRVSFDEMFVDSLDKLRKQQDLSREWREKKGFKSDLATKYGYLRMRLSDG